MRFTLFAACLAVTTTATYTMEDANTFSDYLWAQVQSKKINHSEAVTLAEIFANQYSDEMDIEDDNLSQVDGTTTGAKCLTHKEWKPCREDPACNWNLIW